MTSAPFDLFNAPSLPSALGMIRVSAQALQKYREEHIRITHERHGLVDEKMFKRIADHLRDGRVMIRKNAVAQAIKHGQVAHYMVDHLWVMVVSRDNFLLDIYRKDSLQEINEIYQPFKPCH